MDGRTLMDIMQSPNFSMWGPAEQAFKTGQQKEQANLASIMGAEQRAQAMHPLEMTARETTNRLNASTAGLNEYALKTKPDADTARKTAMQEMLNKMDDATRGQFKQQVTRNMQIAAMAKANGGMLPEGMQMSPEELQMFRPENLDKIIKHGQTFLEFDPEEIGKRQRAAEAERLAKIRGQVQMDVKGTPSAGGGGNAAPTMDNAGIVAQLSKLKEARQKLAALKTILPQLTEEQQAQWQGPYLALKKQAEEELRARTAGDVDIAATTKGKVPVTPSVNLGDAPSAVTSRPQRQAPQISQADLEFTAKKHGITVEEVKKRLGIK